MAKLLAFTHVALDGVMQAPGRKDEDERGGFGYGGWAAANNDEVMGRVVGEGMSKSGALLLGRWTYESFEAFWPNQPQPNPFTTVLNETPKYVASRTLKGPLSWSHSTLLAGDAAQSVATLKRDLDKDLVILGSGELIQSLMRANLIDEYLLMIHPLVLGSGRRLFGDDGTVARLELIESQKTSKGVVIATYRART